MTNSGPHDQIAGVESINSIVEDLDHLLGLDGNFWGSTREQREMVEAPEQIREICNDLLSDIFGMEVRGL